MPIPRLRRSPLDNIPGYAGGTLGDQLSHEPLHDDREARLLETMRGAINRKPDIPPERQLELQTDLNKSMMPDPDKTGSVAGPMPRVHLGVSTKGLQGVDKSIAELQAARDYDREGLGFKVTPEGVDMKPPDPHIDWKDRLKAGGKAALISIANIRRANPDASVAEMLAGGATGGGIGLASPNTGNAIFRQAQLSDMEEKLGPQIKLAQEGEELKSLRQKPALEAEKVRKEQEYRQSQLEIQRKVEEGRMTRDEADRKLREMQLEETKRHNRETERREGKADTSEFTNEQIDKIISEIEVEKKTLGASPPTEIEDVNQFGEVIGKKVNPAYLDWSKRYRELDDKKRDLEMKRKPEAKAGPRAGLTIEGAISRFKVKNKREPNADEIARMKVAMGQ